MPDPINSLDTVGTSQADREAEIASRDEEILRLRDLLIARDAELGAAKGRLKIIDDQSERLTRMIARIPIPGMTWLLGAVLKVLLRSGGG
jgi:hypothetical protein